MIPRSFLQRLGLGRTIVELKSQQTFFCQGDSADSVFYLQKGRARVTVVSQRGKEATITLLSAGDFVGEESLAAIPGLRMATATAVNTCTALKISRNEMIRVMHDEPTFADLFLKFLLTRSMRTQADLVDQLFNSSEKRLARILLIMAEFGKPGEPETFIPPITQETLADMIGTTRSRVSFFMNRFRKLGFISYNGRIQVHKSLLNVVLLDQLPDHNSEKPPIASSARELPESADTGRSAPSRSRQPDFSPQAKLSGARACLMGGGMRWKMLGARSRRLRQKILDAAACSWTW